MPDIVMVYLVMAHTVMYGSEKKKDPSSAVEVNSRGL